VSTRALSRPRATTNQRTAARRISFGTLSVYAFLVVVLIVTLCPFVWVVLASLNTTQGILSSQIVPTSFQWDNYPRAWRTGNLGSYVGNSVVAGIATVAMTLSVCCPAGYAFGRLRFPGVRPLFYVYLFGADDSFPGHPHPDLLPAQEPGSAR
jgi:ABC-type glycerol-3-phosphate transport system permease component